MKKIFSPIINFAALFSIVAILFIILLTIYSNDKVKTFVVVFVLLFLFTIIKNIIVDKNYNNTVICHFLDGLMIGYKISLIVLVVSLGKEIFNADANANTYFICYIPSILYIFDSSNINKIIEFCKYDLLD